MSWVNEEAKKLGASQSLAVTSICNEEQLNTVLHDARFDSIRIFEESKVFYHNTAEEWWKSLWARGGRACLTQLGSKQLDSLKLHALKKARNLVDSNGIPQELQVFYGIAKKPESC